MGNDDTRRLEADLRWVAGRLLRNAYRQATDEDERDHPILARAVATIVGEERWRSRSNLSLVEVVRDAIDRLPEQLSGRGPGQTEGNNWWKGQPERQTAELLYGYRDNEVEPRFIDGVAAPKSYDHSYLPAALAVLGLEERNSSAGRITKVIRQDLARVLLEMQREAIERQERLSAAQDDERSAAFDSTGYATPYIPRFSLEQQYDTLWQTPLDEWHWCTIQRLCVIGDAGTGKSRFVREHTASENPAWISAAAEETMLPGMIRLLSIYGQDVTGLEAAVIKAKFGELLARPDGPPLVVIDDIADPETLDNFMPRGTITKVIVTSRKRPASDWAPVIDVEDMEPDEAAVMVAFHLPRLTDDECLRLGIVLGCRPLLIEHGCAFIIRDDISDIEAFSNAIGQDMASALSAMSDKTIGR